MAGRAFSVNSTSQYAAGPQQFLIVDVDFYTRIPNGSLALGELRRTQALCWVFRPNWLLVYRAVPVTLVSSLQHQPSMDQIPTPL